MWHNNFGIGVHIVLYESCPSAKFWLLHFLGSLQLLTEIASPNSVLFLPGGSVTAGLAIYDTMQVFHKKGCGYSS